MLAASKQCVPPCYRASGGREIFFTEKKIIIQYIASLKIKPYLCIVINNQDVGATR